MTEAHIKHVTIVRETVDERGRAGDLVGVYDDPQSGKIAAQGKGWYGSEGEIREGRVLVLADGRAYLLSDLVPGAVAMNVDLVKKAKEDKEAAKKKLLGAMTQEELDVLGIKL